MPNPGDVLMGRYRILERLGSGGSATVHRAHDERLERDVAVKTLLPNLAGDPSTAARFEREARSLAASSHPGVVAVFDVDAGDVSTGREPFFVMELCPGGSLADRLAPGRRMGPGDLIPILVTVADGLADLHRRGMVHRDIKPQNILFAADRAKLADFGVAQWNDGRDHADLTGSGTAVGTLAYLAPEILAGERATAASDVYALGVVACVGLTGRLPRPASSMTELVMASRSAAPSVSTQAPELGQAFDEVVGAALAVRPDDRPDALSFASGLASALGRWTRDGGPARWSAIVDAVPPAVVEDGKAVEAARFPAGDPASPDDATTEMAVALRRTATIPVGGPTDPAPVPGSPTRERARPAPWLIGAAVVATAILVTAALAGLARAPSGAVGTSASPPAASNPSTVPSAAQSVAPSPSSSTQPTVSPTPSTDPAIDAVNAMNAAIGAARGGPDGLKGKEANDLEALARDVRRALDGGDRGAALDAARKLANRVTDLARHLGKDQASRLRTASADLVRALGG